MINISLYDIFRFMASKMCHLQTRQNYQSLSEQGNHKRQLESVLTLVHCLRPCPGKQTSYSVGPQTLLNPFSMACLDQPVPVIPVLNQVELRMAIAAGVSHL